MRFFFRSKKFKIILAVTSVLLVVAVVVSVFAWTAPQTNLMGAVVKPVQGFFSSVSQSVGGFFGNLESTDKIKKENETLKKQISDLNKNMAEYENAVRENKFLKEFIGIKEQNSDFQFQSAMVIARDGSDPYKTFTIDKGILDNVSLHDPVITADGLVGYISEVSSSQSIVMTILNPALNVSAADNRTRDTGNVSGHSTLCADGFTKMSYLPRNNAVAAGDFILTSGDGGIFPKGQIIGTVKEVKQEQNDITSYAVIEPIADFSKISDVMVITSFAGQGGITK